MQKGTSGLFQYADPFELRASPQLQCGPEQTATGYAPGAMRIDVLNSILSSTMRAESGYGSELLRPRSACDVVWSDALHKQRDGMARDIVASDLTTDRIVAPFFRRREREDRQSK